MKKKREPSYEFCKKKPSENRAQWERTTNDLRLSTHPKKATARAVTDGQGRDFERNTLHFKDCTSWHWDKDAE